MGEEPEPKKHQPGRAGKGHSAPVDPGGSGITRAKRAVARRRMEAERKLAQHLKEAAHEQDKQPD